MLDDIHRFWRGQDQQTSQASSRSKKNGNGGGHNRIFYTNNGLAASQNKSTASVEDAHITLSSKNIIIFIGYWLALLAELNIGYVNSKSIHSYFFLQKGHFL